MLPRRGRGSVAGDHVHEKMDADLADPDEPLTVWGFDPIYFEGERLNASHLDRVSETRPVFVFHASAPLATVNSALMKKMGITKDIDIEGVAKDTSGERVEVSIAQADVGAEISPIVQ